MSTSHLHSHTPIAPHRNYLRIAILNNELRAALDRVHAAGATGCPAANTNKLRTIYPFYLKILCFLIDDLKSWPKCTSKLFIVRLANWLTAKKTRTRVQIVIIHWKLSWEVSGCLRSATFDNLINICAPIEDQCDLCMGQFLWNHSFRLFIEYQWLLQPFSSVCLRELIRHTAYCYVY